MRRYFLRKILIYLLTFFMAVTIDWMIPRFMPGDPVMNMLAKAGSMHAEAQEVMYGYLTSSFGLDLPAWAAVLEFLESAFPRRSGRQYFAISQAGIRRN